MKKQKKTIIVNPQSSLGSFMQTKQNNPSCKCGNKKCDCNSKKQEQKIR